MLILYHVQDIKRFTGEVENLTAQLTQTQSDLAEANADLNQERGRIFAARELRNFSSLEELEAFLTEDDTNERDYVPKLFDCEDFALMLQQHALAKGYLINCQKLPIEGIQHMGNMAICGNDIYYIEARTDQVKYAGYLD